MSWLVQLKRGKAPEKDASKTTETIFVVSVAPNLAPVQKNEGVTAAANDPAPGPDRWCWPQSTTMNGSEIEMFSARLGRFTDKGVRLDQSEALAKRLLVLDREGDGRSLCLESKHLAGQAASAWRCSNWERAGIRYHVHSTLLLVLKIVSNGIHRTINFCLLWRPAETNLVQSCTRRSIDRVATTD